MGRMPNNGPSLSGWRTIRLQSRPPSFRKMPRRTDPFWEFETLNKQPTILGSIDTSKNHFPELKRAATRKTLPEPSPKRVSNQSIKKSATSRNLTRYKACEKIEEKHFKEWLKKLRLSFRKKQGRSEDAIDFLRGEIRKITILIADATNRKMALRWSRFFGSGIYKFESLRLKLKNAERMKSYLQVLIRETRLNDKLKELGRKQPSKRKSQIPY